MLCKHCDKKPCQEICTLPVCSDCLDKALYEELAPFRKLPPCYRDLAATIAFSG